MARARWIKPEFFTDTKVSQVSDQAALLFAAMWTECDDGGVCPADPRIIYGRRFITRPGWTVESVTAVINELADKGLVKLFQQSDEWYALVPAFAEKQGIKPKEWRHLGIKHHDGIVKGVTARTNAVFLPTNAVCLPSTPKQLQLPEAVAVAEESKSGADAPTIKPNPMKVLGPLIREHLYRGTPPEGYDTRRCANICTQLLKRYSVDDLREAILLVPRIRAGKVACDDGFRRYFAKQGKITMLLLNDRWGSGSVIEQLLHIVRKNAAPVRAEFLPEVA